MADQKTSKRQIEYRLPHRVLDIYFFFNRRQITFQMFIIIGKILL